MKMKFFFPAILLTICSLLFAVSCKKPQEVEPESNDVTVEGKIVPTFGGSEFQLGAVYTLTNGVKFKITKLKFYTSAVSLGGTQMIDYSLYDFEERGTAWFSKTGEFTVGSALNYAIGVDADKNHADPTLPSPSSWLYVTNANDMHWTWNSGYIFIAIEGYYDAIVDANDDFQSFSYHIARDDFFTSDQALTVAPTLVADKKYEVKLKFDFQSFFENSVRPIDLATENLTHSSPSEDALTEKIRLNFAEAFSPL